MATSGRGVQRVLAKLKASIDKENYYEAHQMYRTLYFRYKSQNKYAEAVDLLYNGSLQLLHKQQYGSGADLALLLVDLMNEAKTDVTQEHIEKLGTLNHLLDSETPERANFVAAAIKWSCQDGVHEKTGHPQLHRNLALTFWEERNYVKARFHFIHAQDGENCAAMLVEYHITCGFPSEVDLFIAQAVFQYLCLQNQSTAKTAFQSYTRQHPQIEDGPPFVRPLLNFLWFLFLAVEGGKVAMFTILIEQYQPALRRDPGYREYLDKIGQLFFGLPPPQVPQQGGLFGDLMSSLFADVDEDEERGAAAMLAPEDVE